MKIPNNSLTETIKEIVALCEELASEYGENASWFSEPASENEINEWECKRRITIPKSYKEWLVFSNGSQIINNTAHFFGLEQIGIYDKYIPDDYVTIGELIGDGELLCFSKSTGMIIRYDHGKSTSYQSFGDILNIILDII